MNTELKRAFEGGNVQLFVGSGLSLDYFPSSESFRNKIIDAEITINGVDTSLREFMHNSELSLEDAVQFYEQNAGSSELIKMIQTTFSKKIISSYIHRQLWKLPNIRLIYTTNYDCLLEDALSDPFQEPIVITRYSDIDFIDSSRKIVFKPHGCARNSTSRKDFVISRNDYLRYADNKPFEILKTLYDISTKCFVFIGYSLNDKNIRHIITEANKNHQIRAFAVMPDFDQFSQEAIYWKKEGIKFLKMNVQGFINYVSKEFPFDSSEWAEKINLRIDDKTHIAGEAIKIINSEISKLKKNNEDKKPKINLLLDSGTTVMLLAKLLMKEIKNNNISIDDISIITNSPQIIKIFSGYLRPDEKTRVPITVIGGSLRYQTQAFVPDKELAKFQLAKIDKLNNRTLAFIGTTFINKNGLFTKSEQEKEIKKQFIEFADNVYVLADHSKAHGGETKGLFSKLNKKINLITNREKNYTELEELIGKKIF